MKKLPCSPSKGFTVLELLLAAVLVATLAMLALATIGKASQSTKDVKCMTNLRTVGQACLTYAAEHGGRLPFRYTEGGLWSGYGNPLWYVVVAPYAGVQVERPGHGELTEPGPFKCPADKVPWVGSGPGELKPSCSYAFPLPLAGSSEVNGGDGFPKLQSRANVAAKTVMLIDSVFANVFNPNTYSTVGAAMNDPEERGPQLLQRHKGYLNAVFLDGHFERISGNTPSIDPQRPHLWGH